MFRPFVIARFEPLEPRMLCAASALPRPDHVVVVIEENQAHQTIIGSPDAPYINSLAAQGASFTDYHAITHPSQPNYLALFSGSTQGFIDDTPSFNRITAPSLGGQLIAAGGGVCGATEDPADAGGGLARFRHHKPR